MKKNSCTPITPKKYSCYGLKKIPTRNLITKKIPAARKFPPPPPHNFSNGPSLTRLRKGRRVWNISLSRGTQRRFPPKWIENTFSLFQSTFKYLEMHSKRRYKSCICSVVLGQLESFRSTLGPQYYFPENFRCNFRVLRKWEFFWFLFPSHFRIRKF